MPRSVKKGAFVDEKLAARIEDMNRHGRQDRSSNLVEALDDYPGFSRPHVCRSQWQQVHPRLRFGEYGWPQARRVRSDADFQGARRSFDGENLRGTLSDGSQSDTEAAWRPGDEGSPGDRFDQGKTGRGGLDDSTFFAASRRSGCSENAEIGNCQRRQPRRGESRRGRGSRRLSNIR